MEANTTEHRQNFLNLFASLTNRHNDWQVWQDFCYMAAAALAQPTDYRQDREDEYMRIVKKYNAKEVETIGDMLVEVVRELESCAAREHKYADVLGELYMGLELSSKWKGQFFTPYEVSLMMAKMSAPVGLAGEIEKKGYYTVNDPTCGSGVMLIAFAEHCYNEGINFQESVWFLAQDVDPVVAHMCYIQMSLLGMPGVVIIGNTLTCDYSNYDRWYTMMSFSPVWQYRQCVEKLKNLCRSVGAAGVSAESEPPKENVITLGKVEQLDLFAEAV
jgi:hypothetical protein